MIKIIILIIIMMMTVEKFPIIMINYFFCNNSLKLLLYATGEEDNNLTGETSNHLSDISLVLLVVSSVIPIVIMIYIYVRCGRSAKNRG